MKSHVLLLIAILAFGAAARASETAPYRVAVLEESSVTWSAGLVEALRGKGCAVTSSTAQQAADSRMVSSAACDCLVVTDSPRFPAAAAKTWLQAYRGVSGIYGDWIEALSGGIRAEDESHPLSVGYNTVYACLPVNARLDFVAHHVYEPPDDLEHVRINVTTLDRLRAVWPNKPVLLGEFGYSNGDLVKGQPLMFKAK
jgi:hypothetical protein